MATPTAAAVVTTKSLTGLDIGIIAVYFVIIFGIGVYFARKGRNSVDYFLAGRNVGWFAIGLAKKVVLADHLLAPRVEQLFADPLQWDAPTSWLLGILFGFQIYFDFSGYCDMAIGLGRFFGLELRINFATPYVSRTPSEFWSRWNITLSRWFGDYVYVPPYVPHREENPSPDEEAVVVIARSTQEAIVVNLPSLHGIDPPPA